jgi:hypothetical protein
MAMGSLMLGVVGRNFLVERGGGRGLSQYIFKYWRNMNRYCNVLVLLCQSSIL